MEVLWQDLRYGLRQLWEARGLTTLAVLTLAVGIGANTALFTVIESVLLQPLPYAHARELTAIGASSDTSSLSATSWLNYRDIRDASHTLRAVGGYSQDISVVETHDGSVSVVAPRLTPNIFSMLGVQPLLGRTFTPQEGLAGGPVVAILSEGLWRNTFHADPSIVGRAVSIGGATRTVVGVMPSTFHFPDLIGDGIDTAVWLPLQPNPEMLKDRGYNFFSILGQRRPGVSVSQAQAELESIARQIRSREGTHASDLSFRALDYQRLLATPVRPAFYALLAALGLLLLIACANVANLLIARCLGRRQEFAVRAALGAARARLVRQVLTEGFLLSALGCAFGLLLAEAILATIKRLPPGTIPRADLIAIHWPVLAALAAVATLTTVLSSLLPGLIAARVQPQQALQAASRGVGLHSGAGRLSGLLVSGEVALSTLLLIGTGLLVHTLWNLQHAQLGFTTSRVTTFSAMPADAAGFANLAVSADVEHAPPSVATLVYEPVLDRMRALPGVEGAAVITSPPLSGVDMHSSFDIVGDAKDPENKANPRETRITIASEQYAQVLGIPVVRGRMISAGDTANAPYAAVVNQTFARKYFRTREALGRQLDLGGKDTGMLRPYTIVGILADQVDSKVGGAPRPLLLLPYRQVPTTSLFYPALLQTVVNFVVKTHGDLPLTTAMRSIFHAQAPGFALDDFQTMQQVVDNNLFAQRLSLYITASFAALAILMVIAGLSGVLAQVVSYRRREIGIRMALGASREAMAALILRQGSIWVGFGLGVGLVLAFAAARLVRNFLYGVEPLDLWSFLGAAFLLAGIGALASLVPARRAAALEPLEALRE